MGTERANTSRPRFSLAAAAWGSDAFDAALKRDFERVKPALLPLEQATGQGGFVGAGKLDVTLLSAFDDERAIRAKVGVFFEEIVGGCSCGDEPVAHPVYCEMEMSIDKTTAEAEFTQPLQKRAL